MPHRIVLLTLILALPPASSFAQCRGGSCSAPSVSLPPAAAPEYSWVNDGDGGYALYLGESQLGWQDKFGTYYRRVARGKFSGAELPPVPAPRAPAASRRGSCCGATSCDCKPDDCQCGRTKGLCCDACTCAVNKGNLLVSADANFGVEVDKLGKVPRYSCNGKACSKRDVIHALEKGLVDDSTLPRLTVIGTEEARKRVLGDLESSPALAPFKGRFLVQAYPPDSWALQGLGFVTTGSPTIYAQRADGAVLHRQDAYEGPEKLAAALRKADPNYDARKDADLSKPSLLNVDFKNLPWPGILLGAAAGFLLLRKGDSGK